MLIVIEGRRGFFFSLLQSYNSIDRVFPRDGRMLTCNTAVSPHYRVVAAVVNGHRLVKCLFLLSNNNLTACILYYHFLWSSRSARFLSYRTRLLFKFAAGSSSPTGCDIVHIIEQHKVHNTRLNYILPGFSCFNIMLITLQCSCTAEIHHHHLQHPPRKAPI